MKVWRIIQGNHNDLTNVKAEDVEYISDYLELVELGDISTNKVMTLLNTIEKIGDDPIGIGYNKIEELGRAALEFCDNVIPSDINHRVKALLNTLLILVYGNPVSIEIENVQQVVMKTIYYFKTGEVHV